MGDMLEVLGFVHVEFQARKLADSFDAAKTFAAGGDPDKTIERAVVVPYGYSNTVHGWLVKIERRGFERVGQPW